MTTEQKIAKKESNKFSLNFIRIKVKVVNEQSKGQKKAEPKWKGRKINVRKTKKDNRVKVLHIKNA